MEDPFNSVVVVISDPKDDEKSNVKLEEEIKGKFVVEYGDETEE